MFDHNVKQRIEANLKRKYEADLEKQLNKLLGGSFDSTQDSIFNSTLVKFGIEKLPTPSEKERKS